MKTFGLTLVLLTTCGLALGAITQQSPPRITPREAAFCRAQGEMAETFATLRNHGVYLEELAGLTQRLTAKQSATPRGAAHVAALAQMVYTESGVTPQDLRTHSETRCLAQPAWHALASER